MKILRSFDKCSYQLYYNNGRSIRISSDDSNTALKLLEAFIAPLNTPSLALVATACNIAMARRLAPFKQVAEIVEPEPTMKIAI